MMKNERLAQDVFVDTGKEISFITIKIKDLPKNELLPIIQNFIDRSQAIQRSMNVRIKDKQGDMKVSIGFGKKIWDKLFSEDFGTPKELVSFPGLKENGFSMPNDDSDIFFHIKGK